MKDNIRVDKSTAGAMILGGAILGGGGGGAIADGKNIANNALSAGFSSIKSCHSLNPDEIIVTVSIVGAPSTGANSLSAQDYARSFELFLDRSKIDVHGIVTNEIGAFAIANGWIQSTQLGIPVIDAPCNGRAHPTGMMGAMGLNRVENYLSMQAVVGGNSRKGTHVEAFFSGSLEEVSQKVLQASIKAEGFVAVTRNPVPAAYVLEHGAPGAIYMALSLGRIFHLHRKPEPDVVLSELPSRFHAKVIAHGIVEESNLAMRGGFDVGSFSVESDGKRFETAFCNEYMVLKSGGMRIATFPDLIMTLDAETGMPIISSEIQEGLSIIIFVIPAKHLILGAGVKDPLLYQPIEKCIDKQFQIKT